MRDGRWARGGAVRRARARLNTTDCKWCVCVCGREGVKGASVATLSSILC